MPKSDDTKYASEIPMVLSWNPTLANNGDIMRFKEIALSSKPALYKLNESRSAIHTTLIQEDINLRGFAAVLSNSIVWQGNSNRNSNGSPADAVFENHKIGGISIKCGSDILLNSGIGDIDSYYNRQNEDDLFEHIAPKEFNILFFDIINHLTESLGVGHTWTKDRKEEHGKYAITKVAENEFVLKDKESRKLLTRENLLSRIDSNGKKISKAYFRVVGDYYQVNKNTLFKQQRLNLFDSLDPKIKEFVSETILTNPEKICQIGGFYEKPYYVSDLHNDKVYFIPSKADVVNKLRMEFVDVKKIKSFGSGFPIKCKISYIGSSNFTTFDYYICYNGGTFSATVVIKIQGVKNKENLWTRIR